MMHPATKPVQGELWRTDVGSATVAVLDIPGSLERRRTFDIDVTLVVRVPAGVGDAWHELSVELDGKLQWRRRIPSHNPGHTDGLDYHCRVQLEIGQALRIRAAAGAVGARVHQLCAEAREDL